MHTKYLQDNAALAMMERSADAWEHNQFKDVVVRVANVEMYVQELTLSCKLTEAHFLAIIKLFLSTCKSNPCYLTIF